MISSKTRVLVVDDEEGFSKLLRYNLEQLGDFEVCEVNESKSAVSRAREFEPDIILLDMVMPGFDGGEVALDLEKDPVLKHTPVLFLSGLVSNKDVGKEGVYVSNGETFVGKPVSTSDLIFCIRRHIENHRDRMSLDSSR